MSEVLTPDGWGQVLRSQSSFGRTSYWVKGAGFEGWYDGLQVTADFADQPEDIIPNEDNETTLPYPSAPEGPGKDGRNSTIPPDIDPHLEMGYASDSLTGDQTSDDPVDADIEGLFEPPSRLASMRTHRVHFANMDDPILDVSTLPDDSPTGLENSPINPDGVSTDDLFDDSQPHFERSSSRLVIQDDLEFLKFASDEDDDKKEQGEDPRDYDDDSDDDSGDSEDSDSDDDGGDGDSDSDSSSSSDGGSDGGGDGGSGGHTAAFALSTTADLHFLANFCNCAAALPLHSKQEHRELTTLASGNTFVEPQKQDLDELYERYQQEQHTYQESNLPNLVDDPANDGDSADLWNHYASLRVAAPAAEAAPTQIESQIEQLMQFWAVDGNNWWHWTGSQSDLALLNQMQQQMAAVGMPAGPPGQMQAQSSHDADDAFSVLTGGDDMGGNGEGFVYQSAPGGSEGHYYRTEGSGRPGWSVTHRITHDQDGEAEHPFSYSAWIHPDDEEPHTGQPIPVGLHDDDVVARGNLNDMLEHHAETSRRLRDTLRAEGSRRTANPAVLAPLLLGETAGAGAAGAAAGGEGAAAAGASRGGMAADLAGGMGGGGMPNPTKMMGEFAGALNTFNGGTDLPGGRQTPFRDYVAAFGIEPNTPPRWREYLQAVASDRLVALAAWADVVQKAKRLRSEGAIEIEASRPDVITAHVQGDHGRYYTTVQRLGSVPGAGRQGLTTAQVSGWSCECEWGHWAWIRKRSFVGRMCSHAYALFNEMRSQDHSRRKTKGRPIGGGQALSSVNRAAWSRTENGFSWVTSDPTMPTAATTKTASGWMAQVWPDGTAEDSLKLGTFRHSKYALRAVARTINDHLAAAEDVDVVGGSFAPGEEVGYPEDGAYSSDGASGPMLSEEENAAAYNPGPEPGIQESKTRVGFSLFAADDGQDDEGPERTDDGIENEDDPEAEESVDEEVARDEAESGSGADDDDSDEDDEGTNNPGDESDDDSIEKTSFFRRRSEVHPPDLTMEDGPHHDNEEPCDNCGHDGGEHDSEESHGKCLHPGCNCPGWDDEKHPDTDPGDVEKQSSVAKLQQQYGLSHLAGANYSLQRQDAMVREGESGTGARNKDRLNLAGTHYEAAKTSMADPEDTLAFLF